ncbi:hypothetical protein M0813_12193 [Anaeramoeba flamelloides]|uniref:Uncharacterized protein n=1 Tax=Anaeramoeba flamelloides TaxID=1746091 RepID=A0ABQ8ZCU7_9EUKA|nr:hypothetical protein M0813_12193 [Anaeramoeba flamelloides]
MNKKKKPARIKSRSRKDNFEPNEEHDRVKKIMSPEQKKQMEEVSKEYFRKKKFPVYNRIFKEWYKQKVDSNGRIYHVEIAQELIRAIEAYESMGTSNLLKSLAQYFKRMSLGNRRKHTLKSQCFVYEYDSKLEKFRNKQSKIKKKKLIFSTKQKIEEEKQNSGKNKFKNYEAHKPIAKEEMQSTIGSTAPLFELANYDLDEEFLQFWSPQEENNNRKQREHIFENENNVKRKKILSNSNQLNSNHDLPLDQINSNQFSNIFEGTQFRPWTQENDYLQNSHPSIYENLGETNKFEIKKNASIEILKGEHNSFQEFCILKSQNEGPFESFLHNSNKLDSDSQQFNNIDFEFQKIDIENQDYLDQLDLYNPSWHFYSNEDCSMFQQF